jgi:hypothetical protein
MIEGRRPLRAVAVLAALSPLWASAPGARGAAAEPGTQAAAAAPAPSTGTTLTGTVSQQDGARLPGMLVQAQVVGTAPASCTAAAGCFTTYTGSGGRYALAGLVPGTYALSVLDGARTLELRHIVVAPTRAGAALRAPLRLGPAAVPPGTIARRARRDLARLRVERAREGVPSSVVLNPRWSQECAAHDNYEAAGGVLASSEDPSAPGASAGGAWAGLNSDLSESSWRRGQSPWEQAPVHLLALLAPSLSVTGIDDSGTLQCVVTFPGMLRRRQGPDAITTVPAAGARGVPRGELARETPFTPVQFAGLPASRRTGRELFVYLNRSGRVGQAPVRITRASLRNGRRTMPVRWVDSATPTLGPYLAGAILIPLRPLAPHTTYRAGVSVQDGAGTLTRVWRFTTA